jgi:hypothetical protein
MPFTIHHTVHSFFVGSKCHLGPRILLISAYRPNSCHISILYSKLKNQLDTAKSPFSTISPRNMLQQHVPHVLVQHGPRCLVAADIVQLQPGQSASVLGPSSGTTYKAISAGQTTAIVTFHYYVTQYYSSSVSKSFAFTIRPSP